MAGRRPQGDDLKGSGHVGWSVSAVCAAISALAFIACLVLGIVVEGPWKQAAQSAGIPLFALVFGSFAADAYYRKEGEKKVQEKVRLAAYTTLNIQYALERANEPLRAAVDGAYELESMDQVGHLRAAEMAVHLAYGASYQTLHELTTLAVDDSVVSAVKARFDSNSDALNATRPRVRLGDSPRTGNDNNGDDTPMSAGSKGEGLEG